MSLLLIVFINSLWWAPLIVSAKGFLTVLMASPKESNGKFGCITTGHLQALIRSLCVGSASGFSSLPQIFPPLDFSSWSYPPISLFNEMSLLWCRFLRGHDLTAFGDDWACSVICSDRQLLHQHPRCYLCSESSPFFVILLLLYHGHPPAQQQRQALEEQVNELQAHLLSFPFLHQQPLFFHAVHQAGEGHLL